MIEFGRRHDDRELLDKGEIEGQSGEQRMAGPDHEDDPLGIEVLEGQTAHRLRLGHAADDEIDVAEAKLGEQIVVGAGDDAGSRRGQAGGEGLDRARQDARRDRRQRTDPDDDRVGPRPAERVDALAKRGDAGAGIALEDLAERRQEEVAPRAVEKRHAEHQLELLDRLGGCGLGDAEGVGGLHHAFQARHLEKADDVSQLDAWIEEAAVHEYACGYGSALNSHFTLGSLFEYCKIGRAAPDPTRER